MLRTTRRISMLAAAAALLAAAPAAADHPAGSNVVAAQSTSGVEAPVARHADPAAEFKPGADDATPVPGGAAYAAPAPLQCPAVDRTTDDQSNNPFGAGASVVKVIYAHPVNVGNRLSTYAPVIQAGARAVADFAASEAGDALSIRFDTGTFEGPHCLDIQRVALAQGSSFYDSVPDQAFGKLVNEVFGKLGPQQAGPRNFLIYVDGVAPGGIAGEAEAFVGPNADEPDAAIHNLGGLSAVLYGHGGTDFFGSSTAFGPGQTSRRHVEVGLHEVSHNFGAVQTTAPNSSGTVLTGAPAGHCNDQYDLMCYEDGGDGIPFEDHHCDGDTSLPPDSYGPEFQAWDCNKDDYFAINPPGGSYLQTHWNVASSSFLCALSACAPPDTQVPDVTITKAPPRKTGKRKVVVEFRVTERSAVTCQLDTREPQPCESPFKTKVKKRGKHTIRVAATDRVGLADPTPAEAKFRRKRRR